MNLFTTIAFSILYGLTFVCFIIPFYCGQRKTAKLVGLILTVLITLTLIGNLDFLVIFIWPIIALFQVLFIIYWTFRKYGKQKIGSIMVIILTSISILILMQPWIDDWTFDKKDVRKVLSSHKIEIHDDFKILKNQSGGFRDYYETFTIKLSDNDFDKLARKIKTSQHFKGHFTDYRNMPTADIKKADTVDFENGNFLEREYFSSQAQNNGTFHFRFQLDKKSKELSYVGSDE